MVRNKHSGDEAKAEAPINSINHCCKRCARKRQRTRYLPQEVVSQFLLHLPAQLLHDVARHVCREWSLIIRSPNFARQHYRNMIEGSGGGVIIQPPASPRKGFYLELRRGRLEISNFDSGFRGTAGSSCNGLMVISGLGNTTYVTNPLTKQFTLLPTPFPRKVMHYQDCGLAFVEASMVYKLARAIGDKDSMIPKTQIALLTIGVDRAWRHIDIRHLLSLSSEESRFLKSPLVTGGCYVHWGTLGLVLTLNLETETVSRFSPPPFQVLGGTFLEMGSSLSFISCFSEFSRDVWEMDSLTGEWSMLFRFDEGPVKERFKGMFTEYARLVIPMCWLAAREILVYSLRRHQTSVMAYNVKTGDMQWFEWEHRPGHSYHFQPHVNSLLWWEEQR